MERCLAHNPKDRATIPNLLVADLFLRGSKRPASQPLPRRETDASRTSINEGFMIHVRPCPWLEAGY